MRRLAAGLFLAALLSGCRSSTALGSCIGAFGDPAPGLHYKLSVRNTVLAVLFVETIFVPVIVVANNVRCPDHRL